MNTEVNLLKRKILVVCHSSKSFGALEVIRFLAQESIKSANCDFHFGVFTGTSLPQGVKKAYEVHLKSFYQRWVFERSLLPEIIKKNNFDYVLSIQNFNLVNFKVPNGLIMLNGLILIDFNYPIYEIKLRFKINMQKILFNFFKSNINDFFVPLPWMKTSLTEAFGIDSNKINLTYIHDYVPISDKLATIPEKLQIIYPAKGFFYKNHNIIVEALKLMDINKVKKFSFEFTLDLSNFYSKILFSDIQKSNLPIDFVGTIKHEQLMSMFSERILIFPSLVESQGFPLVEAMNMGCLIISIDLPYARESLSNYKNVFYFDSVTSLVFVFESICMGIFPSITDENTHNLKYNSLISYLEKVQL